MGNISKIKHHFDLLLPTNVMPRYSSPRILCHYDQHEGWQGRSTVANFLSDTFCLPWTTKVVIFGHVYKINVWPVRSLWKLCPSPVLPLSSLWHPNWPTSKVWTLTTTTGWLFSHADHWPSPPERIYSWSSIGRQRCNSVRRQCVCLPSASIKPSLSSKRPRRPSNDCFEHVQRYTVTFAFMVTS